MNTLKHALLYAVVCALLRAEESNAQLSNTSCFSCCGGALEAVNGTAAYIALSQLERDLLVLSCEQGCTREDATECASSTTALEAVWCGFGFNIGRSLTIELPDSQVYQCVDGVLTNNANVEANTANSDDAFLAFVGGGAATLTLLLAGVLTAYVSKKRRELEDVDPKEVHHDKPWVNSRSRAQWLVSRLVSLDEKPEDEEQEQEVKERDVEQARVEEEERRSGQKEVRRRQAVDLRGLKPREIRMHRFFSRHRKDGLGNSSGEEDSDDDEDEIRETIEPKV